MMVVAAALAVADGVAGVEDAVGVVAMAMRVSQTFSCCISHLKVGAVHASLRMP